MDRDDDIRSEAAALAEHREGGGGGGDATAAATATPPPSEGYPLVEHRLNWSPGGHRPNAGTLSMLNEIGGLDGLSSFTTLFYSKAFQNPTLDPLIRDHADPHGTRFAAW